MTEMLARVATTGVVEQGGVRVRITKEALESFPEQVAGDQAIPLTADHDPFCLPIGKIKEAWVEPFGEEYAVMARIHFEDSYLTATHKRTGVDLVRLGFDDNPKPFVRKTFKKAQEYQWALSVDLANFTSPQDYDAFANDINAIDGTIGCDNGIQRRAAIPEPLLHFVVSNPELSMALSVGGGWAIGRVTKFITYTVDESLKKVADEISDSISTKMLDILRAYRNRRAQDDRPSVTEIIIPGNLELTLLVKTELDEEFPAIELKKLVAEMEEYGDLLQDADRATFALTETNDWEFLYLTTRSGRVIGTTKCYDRTITTLSLMGRDKGSTKQDGPPA